MMKMRVQRVVAEVAFKSTNSKSPSSRVVLSFRRSFFRRMNAARPTDFTFSFKGFTKRGGGTDKVRRSKERSEATAGAKDGWSVGKLEQSDSNSIISPSHTQQLSTRRFAPRLARGWLGSGDLPGEGT